MTPTESNYFLRTGRLCFRLWNEADIRLAEQLWCDPEVTRFIGGPFSLEQVHLRLQAEMAEQTRSGVQYWPMFLLGTDELVGCCGCRSYRPEESIFELGVHIRSVFWGQGYAFESSQAVLRFAFQTLKVKGLFAGHNPANEPSRLLLKKLGFRYTHDEYYAPTGLLHPSYILLAEDYR